MTRTIATKLQLLRKHHGLTKMRLAQELGVSDVHVYYLETGRNKPSVDLLLKLSRFFGVTPNDLLLDEIELDLSEE